MSLQDLPPDALRQIFFLLSIPSLENLQTAVGTKFPPNFDATLAFVSGIKREHAKLRREFPATLDTLRRLFPHRLPRREEDVRNLRRIVHELQSKIQIGGNWVEKRFNDFLFLERPEIEFSQTTTVFKLDPRTRDIAVCYPNDVRSRFTVKIFYSKNATLIDEFNLNDVVGEGAIALHAHCFVFLRGNRPFGFPITRAPGRLSLGWRDVDAGNQLIPDVPVPGLFESLAENRKFINSLLVSDFFAVVRDATRFVVFTFPSLRFSHQRVLAHKQADVAGNLLYLVEDDDLIEWDLKEGAITRRVTWRSVGICFQHLRWPSLWDYEDREWKFSVVHGDNSGGLRWKVVPRCDRYMRCRVSKGVTDWIVAELQNGNIELVHSSSGDILAHFDLELGSDQSIYRTFVHDFHVYFILSDRHNRRFCLRSFSISEEMLFS